MRRVNTQKSNSHSVKNTGAKGVKKIQKQKEEKIKQGLYITMTGNPKFWILDVKKNGKMEKTELEPKVVVDCIMYVLESAVKELAEKESTKNEEIHPETISDTISCDDYKCILADGKTVCTPKTKCNRSKTRG